MAMEGLVFKGPLTLDASGVSLRSSVCMNASPFSSATASSLCSQIRFVHSPRSFAENPKCSLSPPERECISTGFRWNKGKGVGLDTLLRSYVRTRRAVPARLLTSLHDVIRRFLRVVHTIVAFTCAEPCVALGLVVCREVLTAP